MSRSDGQLGVEAVRTFLGVPAGDVADLSQDAIAILGSPHEATKLSRRGVAGGPPAIREATTMLRFLVQEMAGGEVVHVDERRAFRWQAPPMFDLGDLDVGTDVRANMVLMTERAEAIARTGALGLFLGGDHFITYPIVTGVSQAYAGRISYLHVDMHLDLADEVPGYGKLASGTPVRRMIDDGAVDPARVAIVGIESFQQRNEWNYARERGIVVKTAAEMRRAGMADLADELRPLLTEGVEGVYVSLDIDVLNRAYASGTGNAVGIYGLLPEELVEFLKRIADWPLVGLDLVEVSPRLDPSGRTAAIGASLLVEVLYPRLFTEVDW